MSVPKFEDLNVSTRTVMVYSNMVFDLPFLFDNIPITDVDAPLTKKQKNIDKKRIVAPYGSIFSLHFRNQIRGLDLRKKKKKKVDEGVVRAVNGRTNITYFLNQIMMEISIGNMNLNVMVFKDNFKIAGCKTMDDATEVAMIFWENYIHPLGREAYEFSGEENTPKFLFDGVMKNYGSKIYFDIDRSALNILMNSEEYRDRIHMSQYETTSATNVNIKMYAKKPNGYTYEVLVYPPDDSPQKYPDWEIYNKNIYKKKKDKVPYTTFIIFSSAEVIISGKYDESMRDSYNFFVDTVLAHKDEIEETLCTPIKKRIKA